ncbi:hypothetical protein PORY_000532 [Pneumocystis oryctolagi]|uniref:Uncharacterized protein n=1 Tax=Pneumocystis oryctolagi TaxID=42067 RepID=A0ACB7CJK3_9ASCO|nr:hypothetical protein PORY_000532 [Pneumocystis oryctolagi]
MEQEISSNGSDESFVLKRKYTSLQKNNKAKILDKEGSLKNPSYPKHEGLFNITDTIRSNDHVSVGKTTSEIYQKLSQLEHILKRPDTYIGSVESTSQQIWVYDSDTNSMKYRQVSIVPGLYKIFDEILVNAADNKIRDPSMDTIKVDVNRNENTISIYNNGRGIPIEIHDKEKIWVPELIFGHLLTSSNYDDEQKKVTGGRNGYGAKLCNIFSTEFIVETADRITKKTYKQVFSNNMTRKKDPIIRENKKDEEYTRITFKPDLEKFGMKEIDLDMEAVFKRRVYDLAGCVKNVKVFLNGERIKVKSFKQYVEMYLNSDNAEDNVKPAIIHEIVNDRWEVAFAVSDGQFNQVSFVNSIATTRGGTHVNYITDQIISRLIEVVKKKNKNTFIKPFQIKSHIWVFINSLIENPAFDSQTKETLTLKQTSFGSKCVLSDDFIKKVLKTPIMEKILDTVQKKADQLMKKTDGSKKIRITGLPKLEDANKAGTKEGHKCTLILTEGDSAKSLAMSGIGVVGRDYFGVYPLRGKLLNVREASHEQISKNAEINAIKQIMGLQHKKVYTSTSELRYGHLMIMTDQDHDGSHIKGLIINYLESSFPSLLEIPGFLIEFITPIVKATKGSQEKTFFTIPEYEYWKESTDNAKGWKIKYYKGLGTSYGNDVKKYFSDLDTHLKEFHSIREGDKELIDMAFSKKKADERKEWLRLFKPGTYMDHTLDKIPISDFINKELILFSMADNIRSIPSVIDGLKPGQRKVIFGCFKRKLKSEIKVAQLSGYISEHTAYHHGEQSLTQTIIGLAQTFVGSNNINLMKPNGQFGTRLQGGKDAASPRYIFTELSPLTRKIFIESDDALLDYLNEDGQFIEPVWYVPIIPLILVNGSEGIGTGWSSYIPNFNPIDLVNNIRKLMNGEELEPMHPWYRGFNGSIEKQGDKYKISGCIRQIDDTTVEITELPIRFWTQDMKEFLESSVVGSDKVVPFIKDYSEYHTDTIVHFIVKLTEKGMMESLAQGLEEKFKLIKIQSMTNMVAFDSSGRIKKYDSVEEILLEFYNVRLQFYQKRKDYLVRELESQYNKLSNQVRFVKMVINKEQDFFNKKRKDLLNDLKSKGFMPFPKNKHMLIDGSIETSDNAIENDDDTGYDYLLGMSLWSLTAEKVEKLLKDKLDKENELEFLLKLTAKDLWNKDLDNFVEEWEAFLKHDENIISNTASLKKNRRGSRKLGIATQKLTAKKPNVNSQSKSSDIDHKRVSKKVVPTKQTTLPFTVTRTKEVGMSFSENKGPDSEAIVDESMVALGNDDIAIKTRIIAEEKSKADPSMVALGNDDIAIKTRIIAEEKSKADPVIAPFLNENLLDSDTDYMDDLVKKYTLKPSSSKSISPRMESVSLGPKKTKTTLSVKSRVQPKIITSQDSNSKSSMPVKSVTKMNKKLKKSLVRKSSTSDSEIDIPVRSEISQRPKRQVAVQARQCVIIDSGDTKSESFSSIEKFQSYSSVLCIFENIVFMLQFILVQNRQGKTRLSKWYVPCDDQEKNRIKGEIHRLIVPRDQRYQSNFVDFYNHKIIYRRYAGLFFSVCVDLDDNELAYLEAIHLFVEIIDRFFGNVCELDLIFNFYKVYIILDEVFLAGEIEETSKSVILKRLEELGHLE